MIKIYDIKHLEKRYKLIKINEPLDERENYFSMYKKWKKRDRWKDSHVQKYI